MASTNMMRGSGDVVREVIAAAEPLTKNNIGRYLRGLPFKAKLALRAALHLPQGSLTIRLPDRRTVRIDGSDLSSGTYFYRTRVEMGDNVQTRSGKMTVVR